MPASIYRMTSDEVPGVPKRRPSRRRWWIAAGAAFLIFVLAVTAAGWFAARRFKPFIREQAALYVKQRFGDGAKIEDFDVAVIWPTRTVRVSAFGFSLPFRGRTDLPPLIALETVSLTAPISALWENPHRIRQVTLKGLQINVPPKEERVVSAPPSVTPTEKRVNQAPQVIVDKIAADGTLLRLWPRDRNKPPREYDIHSLTLTGAGLGLPLEYDARLTNPAPKGVIDSKGTFGPWNRDDPGSTPLAGDYKFDKADMGVFKGIDGTLDSTGRFHGVLERIEVDGEARIPNFSLNTAGNPVRLSTKFHSIVDGTSGDTLLQPVSATLGGTSFTARGGIVRLEGKKGRMISLDVDMPDGKVQDLLRLAMKSEKPMMNGGIRFRAKLEIPPGPVEVVRKMRLAGNFEIDSAQFASTAVQDKLDELSRRAQGQPKNPEIDDVLSGMRGSFQLKQGVADFSRLDFQVPGASINLQGSYGLESEKIDFHGAARMQARVSQMVTGWKRWALKPVDPFFAKGGAGALFPIKITGTREKPEFGLNRDKESRARTR